jgi:hypothetical protein
MHDDIYFILHERAMITDLTAPAVPVHRSPTPETTPAPKARHANQWTYRKKEKAIVNATLAGSSSRQPHHDDPHAVQVLPVPEAYRIHFDRGVVEAHCNKWAAKGYLTLKTDKLQWSPFLVTRGYGYPPLEVGAEEGTIAALANELGAYVGEQAVAGPSGERNGVRLVEVVEEPVVVKAVVEPSVNGTGGTLEVKAAQSVNAPIETPPTPVVDDLADAPGSDDPDYTDDPPPTAPIPHFPTMDDSSDLDYGARRNPRKRSPPSSDGTPRPRTRVRRGPSTTEGGEKRNTRGSLAPPPPPIETTSSSRPPRRSTTLTNGSNVASSLPPRSISAPNDLAASVSSVTSEEQVSRGLLGGGEEGAGMEVDQDAEGEVDE